MSKLTDELADLWKRYMDLESLSLPRKYTSSEMIGPHVTPRHKSVEGFILWIIDGTPTIKEMKGPGPWDAYFG